MCLNSLAPQNENQLANLKVCAAHLPRDAKGGKAETFEKVCQALRPRLLKTAIRITRNREDAEDAVQDSLMSYLHIEQFQGNSAFSTWLTRIVMNSALMIKRKNRNARQCPRKISTGPATQDCISKYKTTHRIPSKLSFSASAPEFYAERFANFGRACAL